jgi:hypothetical protein
MKRRRDWTDRTGRLSTIDLELLADTLKERIYASLALLAVLLTLDPLRSSAQHAAIVIGGTALSLWLASIVSAQMAHRMVFGQPDADRVEKDRQRHAPLLASAVLPLIFVGVSSIHLLSLERAITISIWTILLSLIFWSLSSARSMHASRLATFILAGISLLIGLGVVALKAVLTH